MIYFFGDTHGHFGHVHEAVLKNRPAAVVFLGDLQPRRSLEVELAPILELTEVWFIHGNHDTDSDGDYDNLFNSALAGRNLHGRVVEVSGVRVAGLGGIFRSKVWAPPGGWVHESPQDLAAHCSDERKWRDGPPRKHRSSIFPADYFELVGQQADILVTHEAPSAHPYGFEAIDELARSLQVAKSFHGHHHDRLDYSHAADRLGFEAFGVGYCGIVDTNGQVVRPGDFDQARANRHRP